MQLSRTVFLKFNHRFLHDVLHHSNGSLNLAVALGISRTACDMFEVPSLRELSELAARELWTIARHHYFGYFMTHHGLLALFWPVHVAHTAFTHIIGDLSVHQWPILSILGETYTSLYTLMREMYRSNDVLA